MDSSTALSGYGDNTVHEYNGGNTVVTAITPVNTQDQPSKLLIVALLVTSVVLLTLGISAGVGLLNSYGKIHLISSWFTTAMDFLGNTTHFWSLWTIAVGGVVLGAPLAVLGGYKAYKTYQNIATFNAAFKTAFNADNFTKTTLRTNDLNYSRLQEKEYFTLVHNQTGEMALVMREEGELKCSDWLNKEESNCYKKKLSEQGFNPLSYVNEDDLVAFKDFFTIYDIGQVKEETAATHLKTMNVRTYTVMLGLLIVKDEQGFLRSMPSAAYERTEYCDFLNLIGYKFQVCPN